MNYRAFLEYRCGMRAEQPHLLDLGELNLWRVLNHLVPSPRGMSPVHHHRCHLAEVWADVFGTSAASSKCALVSQGVRSSLSLIFQVLRDLAADVWLPADVYPVYGELATAANLPHCVFPTIPELTLPEDGDCLLLPNPLKPLGRWLYSSEVAVLLAWLQAKPQRRLLLDVVYTFGNGWHETTRALLDSGQCILLHSLSKGWLRPQVFGVALVPEADRKAFAPLFQENPMPQKNLQEAAWLLTDRRCLPEVVASELKQMQIRLLEKLRPELATALVQRFDGGTSGYLVAVPWSAEELRANEGILAIPATVFGSARQDWSVLSMLLNSSNDSES
jgi:aspartate/methionine/tyrosine aminotransferase